MSDLIRREDAIKAVEECLKLLARPRYTVKTAIETIPSVDIPHSDDWEKYSDRLWKTAYERGKADRPQGWIPCSERLPKIGEYHISEPCLVYCKGGVYAFAELEENIFGQVGWNCERDDDYYEPIGEVVAWMPLPKPWKGADDEVTTV